MDIRRRAILSEVLYEGGSNEGPINVDNYLTIEARENGLTASLSVNACEYCVDGDGNWKTLSAGTATESINSGQTLSFRGNLNPVSFEGIGTFTISKKCNLKGNCMSMLFGDAAANNYSLRAWAFYMLFNNCTNIVNVSSNFLPALSLGQRCYCYMFMGCTSLINTPELPATTLYYQSYGYMFANCTSLINPPVIKHVTKFINLNSLGQQMKSMFRGCTSLTTAPELPKIIDQACYSEMFYGCTSLTTAPELPATTLKEFCYYNMFYGCTSLTTAPELPATTLTNSCYDSMFWGCNKLNYIKMLATSVSASKCLNYWVSNVASSGTFVKNPDMSSLPTGSSGIPRGWTVVNDGESIVNIDNYLTIEAREDGLTASLSTKACEYCVDGDGDWKSLSAKTATEAINTGHTLSFRGNLTPVSNKGIGTFTINKKCNLKGNCMSMLFGDNAANNYSLSGKNYTFCKLFYNCTNVVNVSSNFLPATILANYCYQQMFYGCKSLTTAPELPATALQRYCYSGMFANCTNLTTSPELPATTLADSCYSGMFNSCTNLTAAPSILPATTLANYCYSSMFRNCPSLTTAPELPATTLVYCCYNLMFVECSKLNYIKMLATDISASDCLYNWVSYIASTGTFVKHPNMNSLPTGVKGIPSGWTVVNDGEEIVNTDNYLTIEAIEDGLTASLSTNSCEYCVDGDGNWKTLAAGTVTESINAGHTLSFRGNLTSAFYESIGTFTISKKCNLKGNCMSILFGDSAADNFSLSGKVWAFYKLFQDCTNIINVSKNFLPATTLSDSCYYRMFNGCTSLTTAPELPATALAYGCYNCMFQGCTNLTTAPTVLPATTLASDCYNGMFNLCTSLMNAPELPATTLATYCYSSMFYGCTKLNYIKMLATDISASSCLNIWVYGVASAGTFVKNPNMTTLPTGYNGIPSGWTVVNDGEESGGSEITFYIDDSVEVIPMKALPNMTWGEFVNSEYANQNSMLTNFRLDDYGSYKGIRFYHEGAMQDMTLYYDSFYHNNVRDYDVIEDGKTYYVH